MHRAVTSKPEQQQQRLKQKQQQPKQEFQLQEQQVAPDDSSSNSLGLRQLYSREGGRLRFSHRWRSQKLMKHEAIRKQISAAEIVLAATKAKAATELDTAASLREWPRRRRPKRAIDVRAQDTIFRARKSGRSC